MARLAHAASAREKMLMPNTPGQSYHPMNDWDDVRRAIAEFKQVIPNGVTRVAESEDIAFELLAAARKLNTLLQEVPLPEPEPLLTKWEVHYEEHELRDASRTQSWMRLIPLYSMPVDAHGKIVVKKKVSATVDLPEPLAPGSPATVQKVAIMVSQASKRRIKNSHRRFEYEVTPVKREIAIQTPALPEPAKLTPLQQAHFTYQVEMQDDVRDLKTFIKSMNSRIQASETSTSQLKQSADLLAGRVARLATPANITSQVTAWETAVEDVRVKNQKREQELADMEDRLNELRTDIMKTCPEVKI